MTDLSNEALDELEDWLRTLVQSEAAVAQVKALRERVRELEDVLAKVYHDWDGEPEDMQSVLEALRGHRYADKTVTREQLNRAFQQCLRMELVSEEIHEEMARELGFTITDSEAGGRTDNRPLNCRPLAPGKR